MKYDIESLIMGIFLFIFAVSSLVIFSRANAVIIGIFFCASLGALSVFFLLCSFIRDSNDIEGVK